MPEEIFRYHFEIQYGWATCYYTEQGVCSELQEWAQFEIYPNYHTPDWAKGAVMYQILWIDSAMEIRPTMWKATNMHILVNTVKK